MMATRPLVSVVMPSFNQARFVEAAIRSVLEQDYTRLELLVADGGSTDGTLQCLEAMSRVFGSRLRWVSEPDSGPASAINKALKLARGEVIGWLNSDDLYAPEAVSKAVFHLVSNSEVVMVYGDGEHIDAEGKSLGRYPTGLPSATILAFQDGCFICQPTVFLRREVFDAVGYLDESLAAAFDFELWLRVFRRYPDHISHVDRVQAFSRLHGDCITQRMRQLVAVEGVRVLARHLGKAPVHWLLTYLEELYASYPFAGGPTDLRSHMSELVGQLKDCFDENEFKRLQAALSGDARLKLALPGVYANVYGDGWAPRKLELRFSSFIRYCTSIRIHCVHARPVFTPLSLIIKTSWGSENRVLIEKPGPFEVVVPFSWVRGEGNFSVSIEAENTFSPRVVDPTSMDERQLSFKVERLHLID